jgi:hypothetical protein
MTIDVTVFINNLVQNNPNVSANVRKGVSTTTALFAALQGGNLNASALIDTKNLSPSDQANVGKFNSAVGAIQSGGGLNPASFVDTSKLSASDKANLAKASSTISMIQSGNFASDPTSLIAGAAGGVVANIKANLSSSGSVANSQQKSKSLSNKGIDEAKNQPFNDGASRDMLTISTAPIGIPLTKVKDSIPMLLQSEVRAIMTQIAWMETQNDISVNAAPRYGRYKIHNKTLINYGYKFSNAAAYTGKNGVKSDNEFLFSNENQDRILEQFISDQYKALIKCGGIRDGDKKDVVAGMIAVAYQFQDANPSLSTITSAAGSSISGLLTGGGDSTGLVSSALGLSTSLGASLTGNSGATLAGVQGQLNNSGLITSAQQLVNANLPSAAAAQGNSTDKSVVPSTQKITTQANAAAASVAASLAPELTQMQSVGKKMAASVEVQKLKESASDFASSLPANKAKEWRLSGKETDSLKRPGSLFFNAGKYAIQVLAADVSVESATAVGNSSTTPPPTVAI